MHFFDLDPNIYQIAAVNEWLDSDKSFHMMRDHPLHDIGMLGSAWGVKLNKDYIRKKWHRAWADGMRNDIMYKARNLTGKLTLCDLRF